MTSAKEGPPFADLEEKPKKIIFALGTVSKKKIIEFSIKGPDPASMEKHGLKML